MVPQHAAVQELREKIRGREEEFGLAGWAEMEEDEAFEIDATLELTIPPRGPPPPPYARECSFEHVLVGKLEGCTRKERKAVSWVDVIPEPEPEPEPEVLPIRDPRVVVKTEEELAAEAAAELAVRRKVFEELDTEGAGVLGREQVAKLVHEIDGTELTEAELDIAMDTMDGDGNGEVDFEEFSSWCGCRGAGACEDGGCGGGCGDGRSFLGGGRVGARVEEVAGHQLGGKESPQGPRRRRRYRRHRQAAACCRGESCPRRREDGQGGGGGCGNGRG